jgi:hypothetical protein
MLGGGEIACFDRGHGLAQIVRRLGFKFFAVRQAIHEMLLGRAATITTVARHALGGEGSLVTK